MALVSCHRDLALLRHRVAWIVQGMPSLDYMLQPQSFEMCNKYMHQLSKQ